MTDTEFSNAAIAAANAIGGNDVQITTEPELLGARMKWRGKDYEMSMIRTGNAQLDDHQKALILDAIKRHGTREPDRGDGGQRRARAAAR